MFETPFVVEDLSWWSSSDPFEGLSLADAPAELAIEAVERREAAGGMSDADRVDAIAVLERARRSIEVMQAQQADALYRDRARRAVSGWAQETIWRSTAAETALARGVGTAAGVTMLLLGGRLRDHPGVRHVVATGRCTAAAASAALEEVAALPADQTPLADERLAVALPGLTVRKARQAARVIGVDLDPATTARAAETARTRRQVSFHPQRDGMAQLVVHGPVEQVTACWDALEHHARAAAADGDGRSISQIATDTAIERLTGLSRAADVGVEVGLVMTPDTLLPTGPDTGRAVTLHGGGILPPAIARRLLDSSRAWLRRLFTDPIDDTLVARDPRRRRFDGPLGDLLRAADQTCQFPGCDHRIRDLDHTTPYEDGGRTTFETGQGLCRAHRATYPSGTSIGIPTDAAPPGPPPPATSTEAADHPPAATAPDTDRRTSRSASGPRDLSGGGRRPRGPSR